MASADSCLRNAHPTGGFQVIESAARGLGLGSRLPVHWPPLGAGQQEESMFGLAARTPGLAPVARTQPQQNVRTTQTITVLSLVSALTALFGVSGLPGV
jgi:hypothetical protein